MAQKRLQNRVAESRYALPVMAVYALFVWYLSGLVGRSLYVQLVLLIVSTYLLMELNNVNALIRIYSRMVSCSYLAMACMSAFLFPVTRSWVVGVCFILFLAILFHAYQDKAAPGVTFYAFLFIGVASTQFLQIVFFVPIIWVLMTMNLMAFSTRMLLASIAGLLMPYWVLLPIALLRGDLSWFVTHAMTIAHFEPLLQYQALGEHRIVTFVVIAIIAAIGTSHYLRNSYQDKIRTRMLYEILISLNVAAALFILIQPQHFDILIQLVMVCTSTLIGHYIALTRTRATNIVCCMLAALVFLITIYNLWMPSFIF